MKKIKLSIQNTFINTFKIKDIMSQDKVQMPDGNMGHKIGTTKIDPNNTELVQARENGTQIIWATINIEFMMQNLTTKYLFGFGAENNDKRNFFSNEILGSNNVSYAFKKHLLLKLIQLKKLLSNEDCSELDNKLAKVAKYRNAFAHGKLSIDNEEKCKLEFYSQKLQAFDLNDKFWDDLVYHFKIVHTLLGKAINNI